MAANPSGKNARDRRRLNKKIFSDTINICVKSIRDNEHYHILGNPSKSIHPLCATLTIKLYNCMKQIIQEIETSNLDNDTVNIKSEETIDVENEQRDNSRPKSKPIRTRAQSTSVRHQLINSQSSQSANGNNFRIP